jgi:hypothetical protein
MIIRIPNNFTAERLYLVETIFKGYLGLNFEIEKSTSSVYKIILPNKNQIIIEDYFFSIFNDGLDYLSMENIPEFVTYSVNPFTIEKNIPVLFGLPEVVISDDIEKIITCRIDFFSGIFFMLTRWEEYVIKERDKFERFPEKQSLSIRKGLAHRPVVDEYTEMLWNMLQYLGYSGLRKITYYEPVITHDVDHILRYRSFPKFLRILAGDLFLRKKPARILSTIKEYYQIKTGRKKDSFDTFNVLMDLSEGIETKSHFYFLSQTQSKESDPKYDNYDFRYDINGSDVFSIIKNIKDRGHIVGIHGSYFSYNNCDLYSDEISRLRNFSGSVDEGRQHYLRFIIPHTWMIEEKNKIKMDSTLGFTDEIGFRCGTCHEYGVFDFLERARIDLIELPLLIMDVALAKISNDPVDFYNRTCAIIDTVRKYKGKFVLLWHTNSFNVYEWEKYQKYYSDIIHYAGSFEKSS